MDTKLAATDTCKNCGSDNLWGNFFDSEGFGTDGHTTGTWNLVCQDCGEFQL